MADVAIKASGLTKWFGEGEARTVAVKDVSFEAYFGEMLYVVGPSGSGKTTMLSMISGILRPNAGQGRDRGHRHLEPAAGRDRANSGSTSWVSCFRIIISSPASPRWRMWRSR